MPTLTVTDASFTADVLESDTPVLVDFWAEWCGPCRMVAPALEELSAEYADRLTIAKVNIDDEPEWAGRLNIRSIPTMILFRGGEAVATRLGADSKAGLKGWIDQAIA